MRSIAHVSMLKAPSIVVAAGLALAVAGCGSTDTSRTATGAGGGAVAGAVVGGPVGAVVGGVAGGVGGASLDEGLGTKADRMTDQGASSIAGTSSSPSAGSSASPSGRRSMASGQALDPQRVREVQQALNDRNDGNDIAVDGVWGPDTRRALRRFQQSNGLDATGRLDSRTMAALDLNGRTGNGSQAGSSGQPGGTPSGTSDDPGTQPQ